MNLKTFSKRVYYDSTDSGGVVYHTEYIKFCEQARSEIFFTNNIFFENEFYVVKELKANYIKPAKLGDLLEIKTKVKEIKKASIILIQEIYKNETLIFTLEVTLVYMKNEKISKIPQNHLKLFNEQN